MPIATLNRKLSKLDLQLADDIAAMHYDPLKFVMYAYPWGEPGPLVNESGPDVWQRKFLLELGEKLQANRFDGKTPVPPIRMAVSSGHGTGKTTMWAWIVDFIMSTRPHCRGTITANTFTQLETKTWAAIQRWTKLCITSHWFTLTGDKMFFPKNKESWFVSAQSSKEENSEAFAGQHAADSTSFYIFDEGCFDSETDVLTRRGWIRFSNLQPDDLLLTPEGWQKPTALHVSHRIGEMYRSTIRGLSLCVTPNHEMWGESQKGIHKKVRIDQVTTLNAPRIVEWSARENLLVSDDELKLLAWYLSEGHLLKNQYKYKKVKLAPGRPRVNGEWLGFGITNNKDHGISDLLNRLGLKWSKHRNQWLIYEKERAMKLAELGIGCLEKTLPEWLFGLNQRQMKVFIDTYVLGDGYVHKKRRVIYTSSERMACRLHALAVLAGFNSALTKRKLAGVRKWIKDHWAVSSKDGFVVSLSTTKSKVQLQQSNFEHINYDGMIYCATVPSGLLLTRREGTVIWAGNSAIPDKIFEVAEGGLTDGEPMIFIGGNCTRSTGKLHRVCFGNERDRWDHRTIDSRQSKMSNKPLIQDWATDYGEGSDFFRVRVLGLPPAASETQFIDNQRIWDAQKRKVMVLPDEPLVCGVDMAWGGGDSNCIVFRQGNDAKTLPMIRIKGEFTREPQVMIQKLEQVLTQSWKVADDKSVKVAMMFIDSAGIAGPVAARLRDMGHTNIREVNFGAFSPDHKAAYYRDFMWMKMKDWLVNGSIPMDNDLEEDFLLPTVLQDSKQRVKLESKEKIRVRMKSAGETYSSPDYADALALTFAAPVMPGAIKHTVKSPVRVWG
jgi:hypothetical protein